MNAFLNFTKQKVSFAPASLPLVKGLSLDDHNEFSSSRGGWLGDWDQLIFFHWVNPTRTMQNWADIKVADLKALYEAAHHPSTDIHAPGGQGSLAKLIGRAEGQSVLAPVREMMMSMKVDEAPTRAVCW